MSKPASFTQGFSDGYEIFMGLPTDTKLLFTYTDNSAVEQHFIINLPNFGYTTTIQMPLDVVELDSGDWSSRDEGVAYDKRICECTVMLADFEMECLMDAYRDDDKMRGRNCIIEMQPTSGFFPFGADKGDQGPFTINLVVEAQGMGPAPYKYFSANLKMTNVGSWPAYALPAATVIGGIIFSGGGGSSVRVKYPESWFAPTISYGVDGAITEGSTAQYINNGVYADSYMTDFTLKLNQPKCAELLHNFIDHVRANTFNMATQAGYYPFGEDFGSAIQTRVVRLLSGTISVTHVGYNNFQMPLTLGVI